MDNMNIASKFMTGLLSKVIKKVVKDKVGYDMDILINQIQLTYNEGQAHVHLDVDATMSKEELLKLVNC